MTEDEEPAEREVEGVEVMMDAAAELGFSERRETAGAGGKGLALRAAGVEHAVGFEVFLAVRAIDEEPKRPLGAQRVRR